MDVTELSVLQQKSLIDENKLSCETLVQQHLDRINLINADVNALTAVLADSALQQARDFDDSDSASQLPLKGIPFSVKESIDCSGTATTLGLPSLKNAMPKVNAPVVDKLIAAGAIPIARGNMSEYGMRLHTDNPLHGATVNPWNAYLTAGGSSGGDAVAVATGMVPFGIGNDVGGSLRNPAYCCGITALKPTTGRVASARSLVPVDLGFAMQTMLVEGPMARSAADLRLILDCIAGRDLRDPRSVDIAKPFTALKKRIAIVTNQPGITVPSVTNDALKKAKVYLEQKGWHVEEIVLPDLGEVVDLWLTFFALDLSETLKQSQPFLSRPLYLYLHDLIRLANIQDSSWNNLHVSRSRLQRQWTGLFNQFDAIVCPTWSQLPWPVDADIDPVTGLQLIRDTTPFITPANLLNFPALSLPMGLSDGLPSGIQIMANSWREDICLSVAELLEEKFRPVTPIKPI